MSKLHTLKIRDQKENEHIEMIIRKHWFPHLKIFFKFLLFWLSPIIAFIILAIIKSPNLLATDSSRILFIFFLLYLLFVGLYLYIKWLNEELDLIIFTNQRIISLEQVSLFERAISETAYDNVQDVKARLKGFCSNVFQFGTLELQTAAEKILFQIKDVPKPAQLCQKVSDIIKLFSQDPKLNQNLPKSHPHDP